MVRLRESVSCERVGDNWLVLCDGDGVVHNLTGSAATVMDCVTTGQPVPPDCNDAVATLVDAGILTAPTGWSRRKVLTTAAAAAAVGMVTVTLPTAAMAASVSPFGAVTATAGSNQVTIDWTAAASTSYQVVYKPTVGAGDYVTFGGSVNAGPVVVTGLTNATEYSFKVQIVGSSPLIESVVVTATPGATSITDLGTTWTAIGTASGVAANTWQSVAYGNSRFVAVASSGTDLRVMYSTNGGLNWNAVGSANGLGEGLATGAWRSVATDGNGVWVAVGSGGPNRVMRSVDNGATWNNTGITGVEESSWWSVAYGNGVWVAVASFGVGTARVMTSPDGQTWTAVAGLEADEWRSVAYGNGRFVAVGGGATNRVIYSTDGASWTAVGLAVGLNANRWRSVAYGNGVWVAVTDSSTNQVMTSTDNGANWTARTAALLSNWYSVAYGNGVWVAVAYVVLDDNDDPTGTYQVMYSTNNGVTWTADAPDAVGVPEENDWTSVAYGNGTFVAVAEGGTNRVMYSPAAAAPS